MTPERQNALYDFLDNLPEIRLHPDPIHLGPKYISERVSMCRNQVEEVTRFLLEVTKAESLATRTLNAKEAEYEIRFATLLATDPDVKSHASAEERVAYANNLIKGLAEERKNAKLELNDLKMVRKALQLKKQTLEKCLSDLRLQHEAIKAEVQLGSKWGSTGEGSDEDKKARAQVEAAAKVVAAASVQDEEELAAAFATLGSEPTDPPPPETVPEERTVDPGNVNDWMQGGPRLSERKPDSTPEVTPAPAAEPASESEDLVALFAGLDDAKIAMPSGAAQALRATDSVEAAAPVAATLTSEPASEFDNILDSIDVTTPPAKQPKLQQQPSIDPALDYDDLLAGII